MNYQIDPLKVHNWRDMMNIALEEAFSAARAGEVPIGAAVFGADGALLASGRNSCIGSSDPTAHAEILALRRAGAEVGNYRLTGAVLAVTLEPCLMCLGALIHARIGTLVFGARDPKAGAIVSRLDGAGLPFLNHRIRVIEGVLEEECSTLLRSFFQSRRKA